MRVKTLNIRNLRNIETTQIEADPCLNCFTGDNGAGKTSILEALAVLSKGRSFRPGPISSLIGPREHHFQVVSRIESQSGDSHQVGLERGPDYWQARHQGRDVTQISELTRLLPFVLLEPSSHTLISGPPDGRRKFLDWGVFHVKHGFLDLWRRYNRALKQRNAALRQGDEGVVESLDPQFVELGEQLHAARLQYVDTLQLSLQVRLPAISKTLENMAVLYRKGWSADSLAEAIGQSRRRDFEKGATNPGPHKADLHLSLDGAPAKERLSRGEQKAMTAALILSQAHMMCEMGETPILMLDDLFSEFDPAHLERVLEAGLDLGVQLWLTGTRATPAITNFGSSCTMFHVEHGQVTNSSV
ncbi:MAG: DNA replication/repair protein RecF [Xanthomonadales bacterium]|nr:DNA replication/repair protein RecF [Xanthomonadales bacterium]